VGALGGVRVVDRLLLLLLHELSLAGNTKTKGEESPGSGSCEQ
jgi:hypothetical protein